MEGVDVSGLTVAKIADTPKVMSEGQLAPWRLDRRGRVRRAGGKARHAARRAMARLGALFALGVMSLAWMGLVAGMIALEKTLPWRRVVTWGTAAVLLVLATAVVATPDAVPGLVVPGGAHGAGHAMTSMP